MSGFFTTFRRELTQILTTKSVFAALVLAPLIYALYYPQPYRNEALRKVPVALVDLDGTDSSRQFARRLDASSDVAIAALLPDEKSAEREVYSRALYGIVVIPQHFERDLLHGRQSPLALYADASYFLIYQRISGAVSAVARSFGAEVETARLIAMGVDPARAAAASDPMPLITVALFNPQGGYATYILPGAFVLILQQTLLMGAGLLGTLRREPSLPTSAGHVTGPASRVLAQLLGFLLVEAVVLPFYLIALPYLYGIPRLGAVTTITIFALPFVVAASALGMVVARLFRNPAIVQLVGAAVGLPFIFLSGFTWPLEAVPEPLRTIAIVLPSTTAINGIVEVAQLGAPLSDVAPAFLTLWLLAGVYTMIAILLEKSRGTAVS